MDPKLTPKQQLLAPIVRELLAKNKDEINVVMAEVAAERLGRKVDRTEVSEVRQLIGFGMFQMIARDTARVITDSLQKRHV